MNALTPVGKHLNRSLPGLSRPGEQSNTLDLRALTCLEAAIRHGSFARAAQELGISASAVSQQLHKLEQEVGAPLLIRHGRGVTATPAGDHLADRTATALRLLRAPLESTDERLAPEGAVSLALPAELAGFLAAPLALRVRQEWPAVTLALRSCVDGSAESWLLRGQVDIAVLQNQAEVDTLRLDRVGAEGLGVVVAPRDALGRSTAPLRLRDLARVPLILPGERHWIRRLLARTAFQRGVRLDVAFQADGLAAVKDMVRAGLGCTVLPAASIQDETARGALVFRPLEQPALACTHAVATGNSAAPAVRTIAEAVARMMRSLMADSAWPGAAPIDPAPVPDAAELLQQADWRLASPAMDDTPVESVEAG